MTEKIIKTTETIKTIPVDQQALVLAFIKGLEAQKEIDKSA